MKHKILVLGMIICCLFGLTACGEEVYNHDFTGSKYSSQIFSESRLKYMAERTEETYEMFYLYGLTPENFEEEAYTSLAVHQDEYTGEISVEDDMFNVFKNGYDSWYKAVNDLGFDSKDTLVDDLKVTGVEYDVNKDDDEMRVIATIGGTKRTAEMVMYLDHDASLKDVGVTVMRSDEEKLANAGLNTLLGMGMAFSILILIALIISLFPLIFGTGKKKKESDKEITQKAMDNTISQIAEQEDLSSDAELVAVIAAAIAAYEGSGSTDGFQVRSIRRVNSNWKKY